MLTTIIQHFLLPIAADITRWTGAQFFHREPLQLPAEMHYVDLQQRTQQAIGRIASTYWNRRLIGFVSSLVSGIAFGAKIISNISKKTSAGALKSSDIDNLVATSVKAGFAAAAIGIGTNLTLGTYDLIQEYLKARSAQADLTPIFSDELQLQVEELIDITTTPHDATTLYPSVLFVGPPGTGKTTLSKWIAKNSNMNYIYLSGPKLLDKTKTDHNTNALETLVNHATGLTSPTIIFIDEAESFCMDRNITKNMEGAQLLDAFRTLTGSYGNKIMFILATNTTETLDAPILDRLRVIQIPLPDLETRKKIIQMHLPLVFEDHVLKTIFSESVVHQMAAETQSFSGRSLFKLLHRLSLRAKRTPLTSEIILSMTKNFCNENR